MDSTQSSHAGRPRRTYLIVTIVIILVSAAAEVVRALAGLVPMDGLALLSSIVLLVQGIVFTTSFVSRSRWREE